VYMIGGEFVDAANHAASSPSSIGQYATGWA
jgi:hypothetical protein